MKTMQRNYILIMILLSWTALILQLYLMLIHRTVGLGETLLRFFSYFTILSNVLVAFSFSCPTLFPSSSIGKFFGKNSTRTAITVYIMVVGIVYNIILRKLWTPQGLQLIVDNLLHTAIPFLTMLHWLLFVPKNTLQWKDGFVWLLYPLGYCIFILTAGNISAFYPYPFINVAELGYQKVLQNCLLLTLVFLSISFILLTIARALRSSTRH